MLLPVGDCGPDDCGRRRSAGCWGGPVVVVGDAAFASDADGWE